jgi:hypothetical protein
MDNYPKTPYSVTIDGYAYCVHEQEKNKFFITYEKPYSLVSSLMESATFILSQKRIWYVEGVSNIEKKHFPRILEAIESGIMEF